MDYNVLVCSSIFLCPCMAINVQLSVQYNCGPLPEIIPLLTQCYGNTFKGHEDVLSLQPMILPKRFDIPPTV